MDAFLAAAALNAVLVTALAVVVWGATRLVRRPALGGVLWLLVLVKLLTPPMVSVPVPDFRARDPVAEPLPPRPAPRGAFKDLPPGDVFPADLPPAATFPVEPRVPDPPSWAARVRWQWAVIAAWCAGSVAWIVFAAVRIRRFQRALRLAPPASARVAAVVTETARRIGLRRAPDARLIESRISPLIWPVGRAPRLVLPQGLVNALDDERLALVVAHELAHVRRGDHLVRWFELAVLAVYWWHPVAWWATRRRAAAADACCDAVVLELAAGEARAYAETLLQAAEFVAAPLRAPLPATGFGAGRSLRRRCEGVLRGTLSPRLGLSGAGIALLAAAFVPVSCHFVQPTPGAAGEDGAPDVAALGGINDHVENPFRIQPYLRAVAKLQALPERERALRLEEWAKSGRHDEQVIVLCRMLFEAREGGQFRRPMLGAPVFVGETTDADWPLEPIAVFQDVPICVVRGYMLGGQAEPATAYLEYCLKSCRWTSRAYRELDDKTLEQRLDAFVKSNVWPRPLRASEIEFFKLQGDFIVDYARYVSVGGIDPQAAQRVISLLDEHGIPSIVEGSMVYGVSVPPAHAEQALALLKADAAEGGYRAVLSTLEKIREHIAAQQVVRAAAQGLFGEKETLAIDVKLADALDAAIRRHCRPPEIQGNPPPAVQFEPPEFAVQIGLADGTRIELELIPDSALVRRRVVPADQLDAKPGPEWDLLLCDREPHRSRLIALVNALLGKQPAAPSARLHSYVGQTPTIYGRIRASSKPGYRWVFVTQDGDIEIPPSTAIARELLQGEVSVTGTLRYDGGQPAAGGVGSAPAHFYYDAGTVQVDAANLWLPTVESLALPGGDQLRYAYNPIADSGAFVIRTDASGTKERWRAICESLRVEHSKYRHKVEVEVTGDQVHVTSIGTSGRFDEWLDLATGRQLKREVTMRAAPQQAAPPVQGATEINVSFQPQLPAATKQAIARLKVGMEESHALEVLRPVAWNYGTYYFGGSGRKRVYFQLSGDDQMYVEIGGSDERATFGKVVGVSDLEPKRVWRRFDGDSIWPFHPLEDYLGQTIALAGTIRSPEKPLLPWVLTTVDGEVYVPDLPGLDKPAPDESVVIRGVLRHSPLVRAPEGAAGSPEYLYFDTQPPPIVRVGGSTLDEIRPWLKPGVPYSELARQIGDANVQLGRGVLRLAYFHGGPHRGKWLQLEFDNDLLREARVIDPDDGAVLEQVLPAAKPGVVQPPAAPPETTTRATRPIDEAGTVAAVYVLDHGRGAPPRGPNRIAASWGDGHVVWSRARLRGGAPYLSARIDPQALAALVERLERDGTFADEDLAHVRFGPDSAFTTILVRAGERRLKLQSWHELFEENDKLVATSRGITALDGRKRADVLREDAADYRRFRAEWDALRTAVAGMIPRQGTASSGTLVQEEGVVSWRE